jgi:tetratricopeptide (TPR) repeat protein
MIKSVLAMLLVAAVSTAVAQTATAPTQTTPQSGTAPAPAPQKKEIKDPAEYNAYMGALNQQDPNAKISGLEAFLAQYPNSVMKEDATELLMGAYQQAGNAAKMIETAQKVLTVNPCNLRALALIAYTKRAMAEAGGAGAAQNLTDAGQAGEKGLQCIPTAQKPDGVSQADFDTLKKQTGTIFYGAAGMAALQAKDYGKAEKYLTAAVLADPKDATSLRDVYPLALADLAPGPTEQDVAGLFYIARAAALAQGAGKDQITKFGKSKYVKYHGSDEGWNDLLAKAGTTNDPTGVTITQYVPPTPAQQCSDLLKSKKVQEMAFAEWQLCLSEGNPPDADTVWSTLKGKPLQMVAQVISVDSPKQLKLAGSEDDIEKKAADIDLSFAAALPVKDRPKEGAQLQFEGTPVSYTPKPFMMTMSDGALLVQAKPKPSTPAHKKPAAQ